MSTTTTAIAWTDRTLNPTRGCSIISEGCRSCYAMKLAYRFSGKGQPYEGLVRMTESGPKWTGKIRLVPEALEEPLRWRKPARIFIDSMSDLFHDDVPYEFVDQVMVMIARTPRHSYQLLTKRPERMLDYMHELYAGRMYDISYVPDYVQVMAAFANELPNLWCGTSVENQATADERIPLLLQTPAAVRFLSCEPLLEHVDITPFLWKTDCEPHCGERCSRDADCPIECDGRLHWIIAGGESGPNARPCHLDWIRDLVQQGKGASVKVFVKQIGARAMHGSLPNEAPEYRWLTKDRAGADPSEWPDDLRDVREFPDA